MFEMCRICGNSCTLLSLRFELELWLLMGELACERLDRRISPSARFVGSLTVRGLRIFAGFAGELVGEVFIGGVRGDGSMEVSILAGY